MKHYFAVSFLVVFLYIYDASAATCTCDDDSTVKVGEYCLVEGTSDEWEKCQSDGTLASAIKTSCPKGEFFYNNKCIKCTEATGNNDATTNGPATAMSDCYIPNKIEDTDEKGVFTYAADCYVGCTEKNSYYCNTSA